MFQRQPWMQRAGEYPSDDAAYHELLARAVFSGGLGPRVVEARWAGIKEAFGGLEPAAAASLGAGDVDRMLSDPGVIRNRRKIEAVIENAGRFLDISAEHGGFHEFLVGAGGASDLESVAATLAESFRHLGPTSAALFLFSAGWRPSDVEAAPDGGGDDAAEGPVAEAAAPAVGETAATETAAAGGKAVRAGAAPRAPRREKAAAA